MNQTNMVSLMAGLLAVSVASAGCNQSNRQRTAPDSGTQSASTQAVQNAAGNRNITGEEFQGKTATTLNDGKLYCLGILLYAAKHNNMVPTNLDQTLPYLRADNRSLSGTNHFDLRYHGSLNKLPHPMTNGIILIRSDSWRGKNGKWIRIYGFADGHCVVRVESNTNFAAWEKLHSLHP